MIPVPKVITHGKLAFRWGAGVRWTPFSADRVGDEKNDLLARPVMRKKWGAGVRWTPLSADRSEAETAKRGTIWYHTFGTRQICLPISV